MLYKEKMVNKTQYEAPYSRNVHWLTE